MARPTVLVVDAKDTRRKELTRGLAEFGYEVVAARTAAEGIRFATGLTPSIIVAAHDLEGFGDASVLETMAKDASQEARPALLLLCDTEPADEGIPEDVLQLEVGGLTGAGILRKVHTVLLGLELGLESDARAESLVGDLGVRPLFDLLPLLQRTVVTGRLLLGDSEIALADGEVLAARAGKVTGVKALARIGRSATGTFRLLRVPPGVERSIEQDLLGLMARAMEDQHRWQEAKGKLPDLASRVALRMGPAFFSTQFSSTQQKILETLQGRPSVWVVVDTVSAFDGEVLEELLKLQQMDFVEFEEPEFSVRIVTDSTADLSPELALRLGIQVVPLSVIFGNEILRDGVDLTPGGFYKLLEARKDVYPRTNPPSKGEFRALYRSAAVRHELVSLHISEKLSQTVVNARAGFAEAQDALDAERGPGRPAVVEVIDGLQVSAGLGMLAILGARMAQRGVTAPEIRARLESMRERIHLLFAVNTLDYLARGGRIGKARALMGGILGIKPILGVVGGEVVPVDRVRGGKAAQPRLIELFKERVDPERPIMAIVAHATAPVWADRLSMLIKQQFKAAEISLTEIGPVVGSHAGPGTVGAAILQPEGEELALLAPAGGDE